MWCKRHAHLFKSDESDASELIRRKSLLRVASGGNPSLLESFRADFDSMVHLRLILFSFEQWHESFLFGISWFLRRTMFRLHRALIAGSSITKW